MNGQPPKSDLDHLLERGQMYRTHALHSENPEDDNRLHHVFWVYRRSYDQQKAAAGLGDIEKHEIDSCLILRGEAQDLTAAEAVQRLAALEAAQIARGGTIESEAELAEGDGWLSKKLGGDFAKAAHHSRFAEIQSATREDMGRRASVLDGDIILAPSPAIRSRVPGQR
ncbi:MAG: hypothetical protein H3C49_06855 [Alphaproteobacteria bacterium]|nr:hypothetical protein [Alphaproteobacteria bacterium]